MKKIIYFISLLLLFEQTGYASMNDDPLVTMLKVDKLERRDDIDHTRRWTADLWVGYDLNKLYLYSEGEYTAEGLERSRNELVFSKAISPFWDMQAGMAYDKKGDGRRKWAEVALSGLAPYYFDTRVVLLVNKEGNIGINVDMEYELLITQKLIVSPSLEASFYTKDDPEIAIGKGLSSMEIGLRMRYEFIREFAPYIGIEWEKTFGQTYNFDPKNDSYAVAGVTFWF